MSLSLPVTISLKDSHQPATDHVYRHSHLPEPGSIPEHRDIFDFFKICLFTIHFTFKCVLCMNAVLAETRRRHHTLLLLELELNRSL